MDTIYLVMGERGEYSGWEGWPVCAYASRDKAEAHAIAANDWCRSVQEEYTRRLKDVYAILVLPSAMAPPDLTGATENTIRKFARQEAQKRRRPALAVDQWYRDQRNPHDAADGRPEATYDVIDVPFALEA